MTQKGLKLRSSRESYLKGILVGILIGISVGVYLGITIQNEMQTQPQIIPAFDEKILKFQLVTYRQSNWLILFCGWTKECLKVKSLIVNIPKEALKLEISEVNVHDNPGIQKWLKFDQIPQLKLFLVTQKCPITFNNIFTYRNILIFIFQNIWFNERYKGLSTPEIISFLKESTQIWDQIQQLVKQRVIDKQNKLQQLSNKKQGWIDYGYKKIGGYFKSEEPPKEKCCPDLIF